MAPIFSKAYTLALLALGAFSANSAAYARSLEPTDVVQNFVKLIGETEQAYDEAATLLTDDIEFRTPRASFFSKTEWLQDFPSFQQRNKTPTFEEPVPGDKPFQVTRRGKVKVAMMNIKLIETYDVNAEGKIERVSVGIGS